MSPIAMTHPYRALQDCWGSHLNRSALPAFSPKPSSALDRDALKASAQYYGFKLKNNLTTLTHKVPQVESQGWVVDCFVDVCYLLLLQEKPVSLKKPRRVPVNALKKDAQSVQKDKTVTTSPGAESSPPRKGTLYYVFLHFYAI